MKPIGRVQKAVQRAFRARPGHSLLPARPRQAARNTFPRSCYSCRSRHTKRGQHRDIAQAALKSNGRPRWLNTLTDLTRATDHGEGWQQDYHMDSAA
jgi:hypothetical protein